jgi:hypothetical protein
VCKEGFIHIPLNKYLVKKYIYFFLLLFFSLMKHLHSAQNFNISLSLFHLKYLFFIYFYYSQRREMIKLILLLI